MQHDPTLTHDLIERVCELGNLRRAYRQVLSNRGSAGIDRMTVEELGPWTSKNIQAIRASLLNGAYEPQEIRGVAIPKPSGGTRTLGIPTVVDRLVQQAILQVLQPLSDPGFSDHSYGFRPGRSAHQALKKAKAYVDEGYVKVVDMDLEKFFDRVNHDILMSRLARRFQDKRLLLIIRRFLSAGMMQDGVCSPREEGVPEGSPLSPLLSNILLDELDKELEHRGHCFVRFADDCNIYVRSQRLRLKINRSKSAAGNTYTRKFLGYRVTHEHLMVAPESIQRLKDKLRNLTRRRLPQSLETRVEKLNQLITCWTAYFRLASMREHLRNLDQWLRRRIRCIKLDQLKRAFQRVEFLKQRGLSAKSAWMTMRSGKSLWRLYNTPVVNIAMNLEWFKDLGLVSLEQRYRGLPRI